MLLSVGRYLGALLNPAGLTRTLGEIVLCRDAAGRPVFHAGNSSVVFRILHRGHERLLKCYTRPKPNLRLLYGDRFLPAELYLPDGREGGCWADIVLDEWTPGQTLARCIEQAAEADDRAELGRLADAFDHLAADLLAAPWAHGDLKPENIVRTPDGSLHPIDFDAMFLPELAGQPASELGTAAYQHPARTAADFDRHLDDFPAALIATALRALAFDPTMWRRYGDRDGLLFDPVRLVRGDDPACAEALARFAREGDAAAYRIARLLHAPFLRLPELGRLLDWRLQCADTEREAPDPADLTLDVEAGRWGFRLGERWAIPPLYDSGFDFSEGLAAVRVGEAWHFIDPAGRVRINCAGWSAVRPFRRGRATLVRPGERREIARSVTEGVEKTDSFCYICPP